MCEILGSVILGGIVGGGLGGVVGGGLGGTVGADTSKRSWRRPLRAIIREGMRTQRKLSQVIASVQAEAKQLVAEAREELDHPHQAPNSTSSSNL